MGSEADKRLADNPALPYHNARACSIEEIQQANLSPDEKLIRSRQRARECAAIRRAFLPSDKLAMERKRGREYMALKRAFMTPEERAEENKKNRERVRIRRMNLPEEKKEQIRKQQRERVARKRREMAPEKLLQVREKSRLRMQVKRASIPPEEKTRLKAIKREKAREYRERIKGQSLLYSEAPSFLPSQAYNFQSERILYSSSGQSQSSSSGSAEEVVPDLPAFPSPLTDKTETPTLTKADNCDSDEERETGARNKFSEDNGEVSEDHEYHPEAALSENNQLQEQREQCNTTEPEIHPSQPQDSTPLPNALQKPHQVVYKAVQKLRTLCDEKYKTEAFETLDKPILINLLADFYNKVEQVPTLGIPMPEFLAVMREGIVCFMREFVGIDIVNDPDFDIANLEFGRRLEQLLHEMSMKEQEVGRTDEESSLVSTLESEKQAAEPKVDEEITLKSVRFFQDFLSQQGKNINFVEYSQEELSETLHAFYLYAKMMPRNLPEPYRIIRMHLAHYIRKHMDIDIIHNPTFEVANRICKTNLSTLEYHLQGAPLESTSSQMITENDLVLLLQSRNMDPNFPLGLLNLCMFNVVFYLCRSLRSGLSDTMRLMDKGTFLFETDENNRENVTWKANVYTAKMPEVKGHHLCPVTNFKKYLSKLSPISNTLWQHPLKKSSAFHLSQCWYQGNIPVGKRKIYHFMEQLSQEAGLSSGYSLQSIQNTPLEKLAAAMDKVKGRFTVIPTISPPSSNTSEWDHQSRRPTGKQASCTLQASDERWPLASQTRSEVNSLHELDRHLDKVNWNVVLPGWEKLKQTGNFASHVGFLSHLLHTYSTTSCYSSRDENLNQRKDEESQGNVSGLTDVTPQGYSPSEQSGLRNISVFRDKNQRVVNHLAHPEQALLEERHQKARRLDAILAASLKPMEVDKKKDMPHVSGSRKSAAEHVEKKSKLSMRASEGLHEHGEGKGGKHLRQSSDGLKEDEAVAELD